jgi:hypothetical protein
MLQQGPPCDQSRGDARNAKNKPPLTKDDVRQLEE